MNPYAIEYKSLAVSWFLLLTVLVGTSVQFISKFYLKDILSAKQQEDLNFNLLVASIIGARIFYVITNWSYYQQDLLAVFELSHLTLNLTGAVIAGCLVLLYFSWRNEVDLLTISAHYFNLAAVALIIGSWVYYFDGQLSFIPNLLLSLWWALVAASQFLILDEEGKEEYAVTLFVIAYVLVRIIF